MKKFFCIVLCVLIIVAVPAAIFGLVVGGFRLFYRPDFKEFNIEKTLAAKLPDGTPMSLYDISLALFSEDEEASTSADEPDTYFKTYETANGNRSVCMQYEKGTDKILWGKYIWDDSTCSAVYDESGNIKELYVNELERNKEEYETVFSFYDKTYFFKNGEIEYVRLDMWSWETRFFLYLYYNGDDLMAIKAEDYKYPWWLTKKLFYYNSDLKEIYKETFNSIVPGSIMPEY
ncbi:MAG: hypothetical protein K5756_09195 [Clostridiales bacterium]|nr:hypothetical protein [Clostridiales bacterium]